MIRFIDKEFIPSQMEKENRGMKSDDSEHITIIVHLNILFLLI